MAKDSTVCLTNSLTPTTAQITGWELVPPYSVQALMKAVSMQPVVAFLSGSAQDFQLYNSRGQLKIYDGLCTTDINRAVLVVGYNYTGSSLAGSYWILKNTWFNTCGDSGYMYLAMLPDVRGKCGIHTIPAMYPVYYPSGPQPTAAADACSGINPCSAGRCYTRARGGGDGGGDGRAHQQVRSAQPLPQPRPVQPVRQWHVCEPRRRHLLLPMPHREYPTKPSFIPSSDFPLSLASPPVCIRASALHSHSILPILSNPLPVLLSSPLHQGYAIGAASDGRQTCVGVAGSLASFLAYPTVPGDSCSSVAAAFGLTTAALTALNPFLNCSFAYLPPTLVFTIANASSTVASPSVPLYNATYTVQPNDSCTTLANTFFAGSLSALRAANPLIWTTSRFFLYPAQVICTATSSLSSPAAVHVPHCGQTYITVAGDTCPSVASKYAISLGAFMGLNSALSCTAALPVGSYVCVAPKSTQVRRGKGRQGPRT
ncbi:unnamed protein product [Closterium sp. Naga37s-1]|nr:unnamed protein product [Closterium sp. Naga37s-1]